MTEPFLFREINLKKAFELTSMVKELTNCLYLVNFWLRTTFYYFR